jgi:hypothetical protein
MPLQSNLAKTAVNLDARKSLISTELEEVKDLDYTVPPSRLDTEWRLSSAASAAHSTSCASTTTCCRTTMTMSASGLRWQALSYTRSLRSSGTSSISWTRTKTEQWHDDLPSLSYSSLEIKSVTEINLHHSKTEYLCRYTIVYPSIDGKT